eukprot:CAMPEP_0179008886 /NCGR_PEP_ID=MMETSP0795-20121207/15970_1 /TAXON_ID=88552 /ORGANISM="Amoebophrya sp., Strain Ameob2" /LENGTH=366 /DNA_ID=CAMNT_0020704031 /DNA_START=202 /DNA_END=1305 /DNA_ORIENTATION=+
MSDTTKPVIKMNGHQHRMSEYPNERKIFVGGLPPASTNESLQAFFKQYGSVIDSYIMDYFDPLMGVRRSRGFGFVVFETEEQTEAALQRRRVLIDNKECEVKRIDERRSSHEGKAEIESRKIFCGGLADTVDTAKLEEFFRGIDPKIVEARVMFDPAQGRSRCFGYVTFSDKSFVEKAVANRENNIIDGKWVDVKPAGGDQGGTFGKNPGKDFMGGGKKAQGKFGGSREKGMKGGKDLGSYGYGYGKGKGASGEKGGKANFGGQGGWDPYAAQYNPAGGYHQQAYQQAVPQQQIVYGQHQGTAAVQPTVYYVADPNAMYAYAQPQMVHYVDASGYLYAAGVGGGPTAEPYGPEAAATPQHQRAAPY